MIECPECGHHEFAGTICCTECGSRLPAVSVPIQRQVSPQDAASQPQAPDQPTTPTVDWQAVSSLDLSVLDTEDVLSLVGRKDYTLGVAVEGQAIIPDIDLGRYDAYNLGVSRIHAEIRLQADGVYIVDLDSANGTSVNGTPIEPQVPTALQPGDTICLGKLPLQLITPQRVGRRGAPWQ